jgi:hypothetical protein
MKPEITYFPSGPKHQETWYLDDYDTVHRIGGPANQQWYTNGLLFSEAWMEYGLLHRVDGPAIRFWFRNGQLRSIRWAINGKTHRIGGPAFQTWDENWQKQKEQWWVNDIEKTNEILQWIEKDNIELDENHSIVKKNDLMIFKLKFG